jgi:hypothetical protein
MVGIERDVGNVKSARAVREGRVRVTADRIMNFNLGAGDHGIAGIGNNSL